MKIKFIMPYSGDARKSLITNYDFTTQSFFKRGRKDVANRMPFMSLAFPILAALTPPEFAMEILDESVEPIDCDDPVDIVALTAMTYMAPYAYRLADEFRRRGVYVVMGGVHVSLAHEEALLHVDSVFIGEAEDTWQEFIRDFLAQKPKPVYKMVHDVDLAQSPMPRWDLVKNKYYMSYFINASRGCCFDCDFCQIHLTFGKKIRYKPVEMVVAEIRQLYRHYGMEFWGGSPVIFSDDNIIANVTYAKKLFNALIPLKIRWCALASTNVARDPALLDLMVKSGCDHLFIGFESLSQESMDLVNKGKVNKVSMYEDDLRALHARGISVSSLMMFGLDGDDLSIFQQTIDFVKKTNLDFPLFHTLIPLPGTVMTKRFIKNDRVLTYDWTKYTGYYSCIVPMKMTARQLEQGSDYATKMVYQEDAILQRIDNLYEMGALKGAKPYFFVRFIYTLYFLKILLCWPKPVRSFMLKIIKVMWLKPRTKLYILLMFIDHFEFAFRTCRDADDGFTQIRS